MDLQLVTLDIKCVKTESFHSTAVNYKQDFVQGLVAMIGMNTGWVKSVFLAALGLMSRRSSCKFNCQI